MPSLAQVAGSPSVAIPAPGGYHAWCGWDTFRCLTLTLSRRPPFETYRVRAPAEYCEALMSVFFGRAGRFLAHRRAKWQKKAKAKGRPGGPVDATLRYLGVSENRGP